MILISTHQEWTLPHVRWLRYCQKTIKIFLGLNPIIECSYFLHLYRGEPKVSKIQIFSPISWANGSQLSLNSSKWNSPEMLIKKHLKGLLPKIWFVFRFNSDIHSHFTHQGHKLRPNFFRNRCRQLSFQIQGPKIWNDLPHELISLPFAQFRKQAKLYILNTF